MKEGNLGSYIFENLTHKNGRISQNVIPLVDEINFREIHKTFKWRIDWTEQC